MSDNRQKTAGESKGFRNQLKNLIGRRSRSTPQSRSNSPSTVVPVLATDPKLQANSTAVPLLATDTKLQANSTVVPVLATDPKLLAKYTRFRILVIGRANAGKTTLLKRVCNTTEEPSIYDNDTNLLEPTSERGIHDVRRSFVFKSNPGFIFHDSPGFEAGGEEELKAVMTFIEESSKAKDVDDQIHVIWFCFNPDVARPLLPLEVKFFNEDRPWNVPVVAIFMKFDDLIKQVYNRKKDKTENIKNALDTLEKKFKEPLSGYKFQPRAYVRFEALQKDEGNHQEQVGELIKQTAASIDDLALKMLFVTVQQNNLKVCIEHAVNEYIFDSTDNIWSLIAKAASWFGHCYWRSHDYGKEEYLRRDHYYYRGAAAQFVDGVHKVVNAQFKTPSLYAFIVILICLEHSFWLVQKGSSPTQGFIEALNTFNKEQPGFLNMTLNEYLKLKQSNDWFATKHQPSLNECADIQKIIFDNLLSHPKFTV